MPPVINVNTALAGRLIPQDGKLVSMAEHFDPFIVDYQMKTPSVWRDLIPKGTFTLFNGYSQKSYIFRGTLGPQAGLADWSRIEPSRKPSGSDVGYDRCTYNPQTYAWAFDAVDFSEEHGEVCPAGWSKGKAGMNASTEGVAKYLASHAKEL